MAGTAGIPFGERKYLTINYCLPQSEAFVQSRLANQSVVAYNPRLPAALATSVLTHGVWKILKLKF